MGNQGLEVRFHAFSFSLLALRSDDGRDAQINVWDFLSLSSAPVAPSRKQTIIFYFSSF